MWALSNAPAFMANAATAEVLLAALVRLAFKWQLPIIRPLVQSLDHRSKNNWRKRMSTAVKAPLQHVAGGGTSNLDWWPNRLKLELLHQHSTKSDPMGEDFNYAKEFQSL